jgi:hypothetical protein
MVLMKGVNEGGGTGARKENQDAEDEQDEEDGEQPPFFVVAQKIEELGEQRGIARAAGGVVKTLVGWRIFHGWSCQALELFEIAFE